MWNPGDKSSVLVHASVVDDSTINRVSSALHMGCGQSLLEWFGVYKKRAVPLLAEYKQVEQMKYHELQ